MGLVFSPVQAEACYEGYAPPTIEYVTKTHSGEIIEKIPSSLGSNCVAYAKSRKDLPQGLWTLEDKKRHITRTKPEKGAVGVTAESSVGHLVIVEEIKNNDTIIVSEGNFIHGMITKRAVPTSLLIGYF